MTEARPATSSARRWSLWPALAAAGAICYLNSFRAPMFFDDLPAILNNTTIRSLSPLWRAFWGPDETGVSGRPFLNFTFAINYAMSGYDAWSYHLFNLTIHLVAGLALYSLIGAIWETAQLEGRTRLAPGTAAFITSGIWMLHPIQTSSVTYIVIRNESLMGMFYILTAHALVRSLASPGIRWQVAGAAWGVLGMASKETMITAPVMMLALDWILSGQPLREILARRRTFYGGMFALWALGVALILTGPRQRTTGFALEGTPPLDYLRTEARVLIHYVRLVFWPLPLVLDYQWPLERRWWPSVLFVLFIIPIFIAACAGVVRRKAWAIPPAAFFILLAPTSSFMPISETAWEYRMYLPSAGLIAGAVAWVASKCAHGQYGGMPPLLRPGPCLGLLFIALGFQTMGRNHDFRTERAILEDCVRKRPANARACNNLANLLNDDDASRALDLYAKAARLNPTYAKYHYNLGTALANRGHHDQAVEPLMEAVRLDPQFAAAHHNLAGSLFYLGRMDEARREFETTIRLLPESAEAHFSYGVLLAKTGEIAEAVGQFKETLRLQPGHPNAREALRQLGHPADEAAP